MRSEQPGAGAPRGSAFHIPRSAFSGLAFALLLAAALAPLWTVEVFPSTDGPNHLYGAHILKVYARPEGALYRQFYTLNPRPTPNWLSHAALAGLMAAFPPPVAEKLLLSLYVLLLPLAGRAALRAVRPGAEALALLFFPFIYSWPLHMGFYNYCFSLAVMLFTLGWWLRRAGRPRLRHGPVLMLLLLLLYACHLVTLAMTLLALGVLAGWAALCDRQHYGRFAGPAARRAGARLALLLLGALPVLVLMGFFLGERGGEASDVAAPFQLYFDPRKILYLFDLATTLFTFRVNELLFDWLLTGGLGAAAAWALWRHARRRGRRWRLREGLLLVALIWLGAYLLAPPNIGKGTYLYHRLAVFPLFALILWLGAAAPARPVRLGLQTLGGALGLILILFYAQRHGEGQAELGEYLSVAPAIPARAVILPVCLSPHGMRPDGQPYSLCSQPFAHLSGLLALQRGGIDLGDYEGRTEHFPTRFRSAVSPVRGEGRDGRLDPTLYEQTTGVRVDVVLVWQDALHRLDAPENRALAERLGRGWRLAAASRPDSDLLVYRRR
jgi:hypothetical protein